MDPGLDKDKTELGVLVLPVDFEVLADGNRLFDEVPEVLRDGWAKSLRFKDTQDLVSRNETNLGDPMRVSKGDADLGWSQAFTGELDDVVDDVFGGGFEP